MNRDVHARFLRYREAYSYFALGGQPQLEAAAFEALDAEQVVLEKKGRDRTDEEEARFKEVSILLFRD